MICRIIVGALLQHYYITICILMRNVKNWKFGLFRKTCYLKMCGFSSRTTACKEMVSGAHCFMGPYSTNQHCMSFIGLLLLLWKWKIGANIDFLYSTFICFFVIQVCTAICCMLIRVGRWGLMNCKHLVKGKPL